MLNMGDSAKKLGENVRKIRHAKDMTQGDLSDRLKIDAGYLSNLEQGKKNPTLATIVRIAEALGVSVGELVE